VADRRADRRRPGPTGTPAGRPLVRRALLPTLTQITGDTAVCGPRSRV